MRMVSMVLSGAWAWAGDGGGVPQSVHRQQGAHGLLAAPAHELSDANPPCFPRLRAGSFRVQHQREGQLLA